MLLLLPPSEGKATPQSGPPVDLGALVFAKALTPVRRRVLSAAAPAARRAPTAPAAEIYTGVLFARLDLNSLPPSARVRADEDLLIFSGLWGVVRPGDRIAHYKLPIATQVPKLGAGLATLWRPAVRTALRERDDVGELVLDLRSGPYASVWRPARATHVVVRAFRVAADGTRTVISHNAKVARGDVGRAVLRARRAIRTPADVGAAATAAGLDVELTEGSPWTLDVLERQARSR